jgi:hypothetical protein
LPQFADAQLCAQNAGINNCLNLQDKLFNSELQRISTLEVSTKTRAPDKKHRATHLLYQDNAYPLDHPISIHIKDNQLTLVSTIDNRAAFVLVVEGQQLKVLHQQDGLEVQLPSACQPGKTLKIGSQKLRLIEVSNA